MADEPDDSAFERLIYYIQQSRGVNFRGYKRSSLRRRIAVRMDQVGCTSFEDYHNLLEADRQEFRELLNTVLINVTAFFRDPDAWHELRTEVIPALLAPERERDHVRVWSAGCASGEEPYSVALLLAEALGLADFSARVKIYATDLDDQALALARQASYAPREVAGVPPDLLEKYFEHSAASYTINRELRKRVIFGRHNLVFDAPISRIDLLVCRNLLIYLEAETQDAVLPRLHYALVDDGVLFLGKAETQLARSKLFQPIDTPHRLFRKTTQAWHRTHEGSVSASEERPQHGRPSPALFESIVDSAATAYLAVSNDDVLVLANPAARRMLDVVGADVGRSVHELAISYRPLELRGRIAEVREQGRPVHIQNLDYHRPPSDPVRLNVEIVPLTGLSGNITTVLIAFSDATRMHRIEQELEAAQGELETTIEELQSANEELETTNEELKTINEELRSTNEELELANEGLRRHSAEAQLYRAQSEVMLASIDAGITVLDPALRVRSWNRWNETVWGVPEKEAVGQELLDLDFGLPVRKLAGKLRHAAAGGSGSEALLPSVDRRGRAITCRVRLSPLRYDAAPASEQRSRGVVLITEVLTDGA